MDEGWVAAYRRMINHPALQRHDEKGIWLTLLLRAAHKPADVRFRGKVVKLERGQLAISLREEAERGGTSYKRLRNIIDAWRREGMLTLGADKGAHFCILTICNFDAFQDVGAQSQAQKGRTRGALGAHSGRTEQQEKKDSSYETPNGVSPEDSSIPFEAAFREFYAAYPRKVGPQKAAEKYRAALKQASHEEIMDGLRRAILAWKSSGTAREYIPHPATWLHGGRWADEQFEAKPNGHIKADPFFDVVRDFTTNQDSNDATDEFGPVLEGTRNREPHETAGGGALLDTFGGRSAPIAGGLHGRVAALPGPSGGGWVRPVGSTEGDLASLGGTDWVH